MTRTWKLLVLLLVVALGVGVAACGSDSDSDSGGDSGTESSQSSGIEGVNWTLMNIASGGSASSLPNTVEAPTLEFADGQVQIFTGCNSGSGPAEITDTTIEFGAIALTKKGCEESVAQLEQVVTQTLQGTVDYSIDQGSLVIDGTDTSLVFTQG